MIEEEKPEDPEPEEYINPKGPTTPPSPTTAEWISHQITHMPYKPWCPICVKNAATNIPHRMTHHSRGVAMFSMDYMFMTQKPNEEDLMYPILVIKEKISNGVWALPVIRKGAYKSKIIKRVIEVINSVGSPKIIIKSDQEPAIVDLQKDVRKELWNEIIEITKQAKGIKEGKIKDDFIKPTGGEVILENSPVGESQSNGFIENGIREVQNQVRKFKNQLELNSASQLNSKSPILPWLIRYAAQTIHSFKIHRIDGRTSRQRIRSDPTIPEIPKFGERVMFKPAKTVSIQKDQSRWRTGIWLGFIDDTNEHIIGTCRGTLKCRAIRRFDASEQFSAVEIDEMRGSPWEPIPGRNTLRIPTNIEETGEVVNDEGEADGYAEEHKTEELFQPTIDVDQDESAINRNQPRESQNKPRELRIARDTGIGDSLPMGFRNVSITKDLVIKYGKTKGCAGCKYAAGEQSWFQGHSQHCRKRFLELSEEPGNEELKGKIDRALEKATRRYLDA